MHVTWQNILSWNILPHHIKLAIFKMNILGIFYEMAWNIFEDSFLLK